MVTADVASLYTIIPHELGLSAVSYYLDKDSSMSLIQKEFIMDLLKYAATHNYFWFGGGFFLQNRGVAMGAKHAPSVTNLFMARWEDDVIYAR